MIFPTLQDIKSFAFIPQSLFKNLNALLDSNKTAYQLFDLLQNEYSRINEGDLTDCITYKKDNVITENETEADHLYITTELPTGQNDFIVLDFALNDKGPQKYLLNSFFTKTEFTDELFANLGSDNSNMLYNYAYWPNFKTDLKRLKNDIALPENWSYSENPTDDDYPILISYIKYTFSKLWKDKQVVTSVKKNYSAFNTGLVNKNYQYIYAVFEKNPGGTRIWKFYDFCIPAVKFGGRLLAENFINLPKPAHYFSSISDISYVISPDKTPDEQLPEFQFDHYFIDHPERLPKYFLEDGCRKDESIVDLLKLDLSSLSEEDIKAHWKNIGTLIGDNPDVYDDLESAFRNAVRKTIMRVSWNYRTAIPVYFPTHNKMSILLPLSFGVSAKAEVALVVEKMQHTNRYIAPTILDLPKAYSNARLVCKPESDWLNQTVFTNIPTTETDTDHDENM